MYRFTLTILLSLFIQQVHAQTLAVEKLVMTDNTIIQKMQKQRLYKV